MINNCTPFGVVLDGRDFSSENYRFGFQGQERDDEIKGEGNSWNYKYRMHDPRLGRFFAVDPLTKKYPFYSPYQFAGNKVIFTRELEGLEPENFPDGDLESQVGKTTTARNNLSGKWFNYTLVKKSSNSFGWKESEKEVQDPNWASKIGKDKNPAKALANSLLYGGNEYISSTDEVSEYAPTDLQNKLSVTMTTLSLDLAVVESLGGLEKATKLLESASFDVVYNGNAKTYSMKFHGNQYVSAKLIKEAKGSVETLVAQSKTALNVVKGAGLIVNVFGLALTVNQAIDEKNATGGVSTETKIDIAMGVVGFIGVPGTLVSGTYFFIAKPLAKGFHKAAIETGATLDNYGLINYGDYFGN